jgi:photosystem II stability/assembly factor-like uncharacterized protein
VFFVSCEEPLFSFGQLVPSLRLLLLTSLLLAGGAAQAHDPSAYGGLFRTRDFGASWLNADVGLFLGGAVSLAIDPNDSTHLLLGTDTGLLRSRNGGRAWAPEAPGKLFGSVFAVGFVADGKAALCVTPGGVFRQDGGDWHQARAPAEAAPAKAVTLGAAPGQVYLIGRRELYRSDDDGETWSRIEHGLPDQPEFSALAVARSPSEVLYAIIDGAVMISRDAGRNWQLRSTGLPSAQAEALTLDPDAASRLWVASANRIHSSNDGGASWQPVGNPLPEPDTSVRGIAADAAGTTVVLATHRGLYRTADSGQTWGFLEGNLPVHLEARPLLREPSHAQTLYAGYALMPYGELWRRSLEGSSLLSRVDPVSLAGALAFLLLLIIAGAVGARWLFRRRALAPIPTRDSSK